MQDASTQEEQPQIPQELIDRIVEELFGDKDSLHSCALTSQSFRVPSQKCLFHRIELYAEKQRWSHRGASFDEFTLNLCERLYSLFETSPHLANYIKDLAIFDPGDTWLTEENSLPFILPLLTNLERIYISGGLWEASLCIEDMLTPVKESLCAAIHSPKITHVGFQGVEFGSINDILSFLAGSTGLKSLTLFSVDVTDEESGSDSGEPSGNQSLQCQLSSLSLFVKDPVLPHLVNWLTQSGSLNHLLQFSFIAENTEQLSIIDRVVLASKSSLQETNITLGSRVGDDDDDDDVEDHNNIPPSIPDLTPTHTLNLGFFMSSDNCQSVLNWWCNALDYASDSKSNLETVNMYILTEADEVDDFEYSAPGWERLDKILAENLARKDGDGVKLNIQLKLTEEMYREDEDDDDEEEVAQLHEISCEAMRKLGGAFPLLNQKKRLFVGEMTESVLSYFSRFFGTQLKTPTSQSV
ncbi:hypothetical protein VKT23_010777 [Stygiomarasmius scandens]|uniref:F-box domain-containing protein n=1 Tax=Marasmiellus scandens TaxID=2682957 RepID=A0ABR1JFB4_9AGAR